MCHIRPDGDAIGSAVALYLGLNKIGVKTDVYCADNIPEKFSFIKSTLNFKRVLDTEYSALVAVDSAEITRLGDFAEVFYNHKNTYNIDHHVSNTRYAKINYVEDNASNSENVLKLAQLLNVQIDSEIANLLFMGILTDTGGFKHKNVKEETLLRAGQLIGLGADGNSIYYHCFTKQSKERAKLFALATSRIRYFLEDRFAVLSIFLKDFEDTGAKPEDTEGFIDFVMGIDCVEVGACVMQMQNDKYKISFRAKNTDVNAVAGVFGGGGHVLASGCQISGDYEEVIDKIRYAVKTHIKE